MYRVSWYTELYEGQYYFHIGCLADCSTIPQTNQYQIQPMGNKFFDTEEEAHSFAIKKRIEGNQMGYLRSPQDDF